MNNQKYDKFKEIVRTITSDHDLTEELYHEVLSQLYQSPKYSGLTESEQVWFFIRTLKNQYHSSNSRFHKVWRKVKFEEINNLSIEDENYQERPSVDWIYKTLQEELERDPNFWYEKGLMELWMKDPNIDKIHKRTKIPKYSIRDTINKMKKWIIKKWDNEYGKDQIID